MAQIGEEDIQFYDVLQAATGSFGDGSQVVENAADLRFNSFHDFHAGRVQRYLTGQVDGVADLDGL